MRYAYYAKLRPRQKAIYRKSDEIRELALPRAERLRALVLALAAALQSAERPEVEHATKELGNAILAHLGIPPVRIKVLAVRPSKSWGELHGLYEPPEGRALAIVTLWMRTSHHKKVVAFRTFLRTLLHELCHHIDYELLRLEDSFHTEGFFKRESSLFKQLVGKEPSTELSRAQSL